MKVLFVHQKNSDNYRNRVLFPLFMFPILGILYLWNLGIGIFIKMIGGILLLFVSISFYRNTPFQKDTIIVTEDKIEILKNNKRRTIFYEEINSINSNSRMSINLKDGKQVILKFSDWNMGLQKARDFNSTINEQMKKNTTDNKL